MLERRRGGSEASFCERGCNHHSEVDAVGELSEEPRRQGERRGEGRDGVLGMATAGQDGAAVFAPGEDDAPAQATAIETTEAQAMEFGEDGGVADEGEIAVGELGRELGVDAVEDGVGV